MEWTFTHRTDIQSVFRLLFNGAHGALSTEYSQVLFDVWQIA